MTFRQFLTILLARRKLFLAVLASCVLLALVTSLLLPKKYSAAASVVVDVKPDPVAPVAFQSMVSPAVIATQVDIIKSERVARKVVRNLKLAENPGFRKAWQSDGNGRGDIETWLIALLHRELEVKPARESSVIDVNFQARDPRIAAAMANAFAQAYLEISLELRTDPAKRYASFFSGRVKEARDELEHAQARLSAFQAEKGIIASDERLDVENQRLNDLSSQLVGIQALAADTGSRQSQARSGSADRLQEVLNNPLIGGLKADLARAEARLQELNAKLGDNHPQVRETKASIAEIRAKIDQETSKVTGGVSVSAAINRQREAELRNSLETQRGKVLKMKGLRDEGAVISREVENAQRTYDALLSRATQSSLESQATSTSMNLLNEAVEPLEASSPKVLLNTLLAVFFGLFLGAGVALVAELFDRKVRAVDDVRHLLDLPLLGVLPELDAKPARFALLRGRPSREQKLVRHNNPPDRLS